MIYIVDSPKTIKLNLDGLFFRIYVTNVRSKAAGELESYLLHEPQEKAVCCNEL